MRGPWLDNDDTRPEFVDGFIKRLEDMIDDGGYEGMETFLQGVRDTVKKTRRITERQRGAVDEIEERVRGRWR